MWTLTNQLPRAKYREDELLLLHDSISFTFHTFQRIPCNNIKFLNFPDTYLRAFIVTYFSLAGAPRDYTTPCVFTALRDEESDFPLANAHFLPSSDQ